MCTNGAYEKNNAYHSCLSMTNLFHSLTFCLWNVECEEVKIHFMLLKFANYNLEM